MLPPNTVNLPSLWRDLSGHFGAFLATHIMSIALAYCLLVPLFSLLFEFAISLSGQKALSDQEILFFALTPAGFVTLLLVASLGGVVLVFKHSALMAVAYGAQCGEHVHFWQALGFVLRRARRVLRLALRIVLQVALYLVPFLLALAMIYRGLLGDYDINFYLANRPPAFWWAVLLAMGCASLLVVLLFRLAVAWFFALPLVLFSPMASGDALVASRAASRSERGTIVAAVLIWLVFNGLLLGAAASVVNLLGRELIPGVLDHIRLLVVLLGVLLLLSAALWLLSTAVSSSVLALIMVRLFDAAGFDHADAGQRQLPAAGDEFELFQSRRRALLVLVLCLLAAVAFSWLSLERLTLEDRVVLIAHRGASAVAPENTLAAVEAALDQRTDWVEIDVQETADGEVVVLHDSDLKKVGGVDLKIWEATTAQLAEIDIGSWFDPRFKDQRVPRLSDVLDMCRGRAGVLIELKYYGHNQKLEERVAAIVEAAGMVDQVMLMSLDYTGTQRMRALRPEWPVGLLTSVAAGNLGNLDLDFYAVNARFGSRRFVSKAQGEDRQVMVWTVNDGVTMSRMMSRGVDGIITDAPGLGRDVLAERTALNAGERLLIELAGLLGHEPELAAQ